jgi:signal transduction histidine kinase
MESLMLAPLLVGDRVLGVMVVQSPLAHAFAEREELIFRALCGYGAIALDNASAYQQLQDTQQQLVYQGKMAALGALVAGVAHELNTPIGNSLLAATSMVAEAETFSKKFRDDAMRRSDLSAFIAMTNQSNELILRGLTSAANLVRSFKQVAVDRSSEARRLFSLRHMLEELLATAGPLLASGNHSIVLAMPQDVEMDSYPEALIQVLNILIENAVMHAFENRMGGSITVAAHSLSRNQVELTVHDDGRGIASQHLERVFDPFFTTKMGKGSNGLGLNVCYNMVTSILNGSVHVRSVVGAGTTFFLQLPVGAP